jgi:hypothetical protein
VAFWAIKFNYVCVTRGFDAKLDFGFLGYSNGHTIHF